MWLEQQELAVQLQPCEAKRFQVVNFAWVWGTCSCATAVNALKAGVGPFSHVPRLKRWTSPDPSDPLQMRQGMEPSEP